MIVKKQPFVTMKWQLTLLGIVIIIIIIFSGVAVYMNAKKSIIAEKHRMIQSIAKLKIRQISEWHKERINDVKSISESSLFILEVKEWIGKKNDLGKQSAIKNHIVNMAKLYQYSEIDLVLLDGQLILSSNPAITRVDHALLSSISNATHRDPLTAPEFNYTFHDKKVSYDLIAPMHDDRGKMIAIIIFRIDPNAFLIPYIQHWPTSSASSETYLCCKEKDSILFLNDVRFVKNSAMKLRVALTQKEIPAVVAALGYTGVFEGKDYRGVKVLSWVGPVKDTQWFLVAKIDESEFFSEISHRAVMTTLFTLFFILLTGLGLSWIYYSRQRNIYRSLFSKEKELRESQEKFRTTLYSIGDGVITTDTSGRVVHMNPVAEQMTGYSESESFGKPLEVIFQIINEQTHEPVENPVGKVLNEGLVIGLANHTLLVSKDGTEIPIAESGTPIINDEKQIIGMVLVFRDQTLEREARKEISESEFRYNTFINTCKDIMFIKDEKFRYIVVNDRLADFFGIKKEEILNKTDFDLMGKDAAIQCEATDLETINSNSTIISEEAIGNKLYETTKFPMPLKNNKIGIGSIIRDVTDNRKMVIELIDAKEKAEENDRLKTAFLNNLSHEIRTPLNGILGFTELLNDPLCSLDDRLKYGKIITTSSIRLMDIMTDIISIATIEAGQEKLRESMINVKDLINEIDLQFRPKIDLENVEFRVTNLIPQEDEMIITDRTKLFQVISNLLSNAIKFTNKGHIELNVKLQDGTLRFSVEDTGIGISPIYHQAIFERFRQVDDRKETVFRGNGLGLAISKAYVEMMGGKIEVHSRPWEGSVFKFSIPYKSGKEDEIAKKEPSIIPEKKYSNQAKTILIAEDEESNYLLMEQMLHPFNYRIFHVSNGEDAVQTCILHPEIDLVLMDIKMPMMNGYEATRLIKKERPYLPVIAVTAYALIGDRQKAMAAGCDDYISKPFTKDDLVALINKYSKK